MWIDEGVPEPDRDSGSVRSVWLLRVLTFKRYAVTFLPHVPRSEEYAQQLRFHGVQVLPATAPADMVLKQHPDASGCMYDGFILSRPDIFEAYAPAIRATCPGAALVYDTVDVHFLREARAALSQGTNLDGAPC
jgi:hypothetical protein